MSANTQPRAAKVVRWLLAAAVVLLALAAGAGAAAAQPATFVVPGQPGAASDLHLTDVAEQSLGDGRRWPEIFALNSDRVQADGKKLTDPSKLVAGWVLVLPAGATSNGIDVSVSADAPPPSRPVAETTTEAAVPPAAERQAPAEEPFPVLKTAAIVGGGLLAGLAIGFAVVLLLRRRKARAVPPPVITGSRAVLDRALRQLATQPSPPQVYAAVVGQDRVSLRLTPALPEAPPPWQAREQGSIWEAPNWQLDDGQAAQDTGLPLLASVGSIGGELTVVNLGRAPGIVALTGERDGATAFASAVIEEIAATSAVTITVVGPVPRNRTRPDRLRVTSDIRDLVGASAPRALGENATGQMPNPLAALRGHLVVVTASVPSAVLEQLTLMATLSDNTAAVLVVGEVPNAAWRFIAQPGGELDVSVLGLHLDTHPKTKTPTKTEA